MLIPSAVFLVGRSATLASDGFALEAGQRLSFQTTYSNGSYGLIAADVEFLNAPGSREGPIFVAGDPLYYWLSDRGHAIAESGWTLEYYVEDQWRNMTAELESALPPYVFVSRDYEAVIDLRGPEFAAFLAERYDVLRVSEGGTWFEQVG